MGNEVRLESVSTESHGKKSQSDFRMMKMMTKIR